MAAAKRDKKAVTEAAMAEVSKVTKTAAEIEKEEYEAEQEAALANSEAASAVSGFSDAQASEETVTVCLNWPQDLRFDVEDSHGVLHTVIISGNATYLRGKEKGTLPTGGKYGMTFGVNAELWDAVVKKYGYMGQFKHNLIFARRSGEARTEVKLHTDSRNGYEPVDPKKAANTKPSDVKPE